MIKMIERIMEDTTKSEEMEQHFIERTKEHINLVRGAIDKIVNRNPEWRAFYENELIQRGEVHDQSKFEEPERTPYISITWRHKEERDNDEFDPINDKGYQTPGMLSKKEENQATLHHVTTNSHHPEAHLKDKSDANINAKDRDKSDKCIDASNMPNIDIAEMVADWQAMSEELQKNTAREWFDKQKDIRWHFSDEQVVLIDKLLKVFEE